MLDPPTGVGLLESLQFYNPDTATVKGRLWNPFRWIYFPARLSVFISVWKVGPFGELLWSYEPFWPGLYGVVRQLAASGCVVNCVEPSFGIDAGHSGQQVSK